MNPGGFDPDTLEDVDIEQLRESMSWDDDTPLIVGEDVYDVCESCM